MSRSGSGKPQQLQQQRQQYDSLPQENKVPTLSSLRRDRLRRQLARERSQLQEQQREQQQRQQQGNSTSSSSDSRCWTTTVAAATTAATTAAASATAAHPPGLKECGGTTTGSCPCIVESELHCNYIGGFLASTIYKTRVQNIIQQERIQQHVEMVVEVPAPMTQEEEIVRAPTIIQQDHIHQQQVPVPMTQEEIVHAPTIIQQDRIHQQQVSGPMTQEEIVHAPPIIQQDRIHHQQVPVPVTQEEVVRATTIIQQDHIHQQQAPVPTTPEEIVHEPPIIQQERSQQQHFEIPVELPVPLTLYEIVELPGSGNCRSQAALSPRL